jgi:hypothetical protein
MQFKINFTDDITLIYDLVNEEVVDDWTNKIKARTINDCCPINHYIGYVPDQHLSDRIQRLYELADIINAHVTDRVIKVEITKDNYQDAINTMHVHFPELKNDEKYIDIWSVLTEYNDLIHWIESTAKMRWGNANISESGLFRITLDFNKSNTGFSELPESAYKLFDPHTLFGDLKLHYTHIGRHAHELFLARDTICPSDQFIPQHSYSASVRMHFTDDFYINPTVWKSFYDKRGKEFWGMEIDDPKIAFGYVKIGSLSSIVISEVDYAIPKTITERHVFRNKIAATKVLSWEII